MHEKYNILDIVDWILKTYINTYKGVFIPKAVEESVERIRYLDSSGFNAFLQDSYAYFKVLKIANPKLYELWDSYNDLEKQQKLKISIAKLVVNK